MLIVGSENICTLHYYIPLFFKPSSYAFLEYTVLLTQTIVIHLQSVVSCLWHPKLNQIVVGCGNGTTKIYFDPEKSNK